MLSNIVALAQRSIERVLAYSSLARVGYAWGALVAHNVLRTTRIVHDLAAGMIFTSSVRTS